MTFEAQFSSLSGKLFEFFLAIIAGLEALGADAGNNSLPNWSGTFESRDKFMDGRIDGAPSDLTLEVETLTGEWRVVLVANDTECCGRAPA